MAQKEFVHLHVHSHNSLLDGMSTQEEIAATCAAMKSRAFALTDHGYVAGAVAAYNAAKKHDIKFIPGEEIYLCRDNTASPTKNTSKTHSNENETTHMLLLAKNQEGLRNLYKLSSEGATTGSHGAQARRVTNEHLERHASGLITTTGCLSSRVSKHLKRGEYDRAVEEAAIHRDIFGRENFFVEVQNHGIDDQLAIIGDQLRLAKDLGVGLVATNDTHYTSPSDVAAHDHLLALQTGKTTMEEPRFKFDSDQHYIKTADEMWSLFPEDEFPGACENTLAIADMVEDIKLDDNGLLIPEFEYQEYGYDSVDAMLTDRAYKGISEIMDGHVPEHYLEQMERELEVIRNMGIQSYFLIVAAILQFCREKGIWTGPGRGSAAGSLVVYALRITKVDPIEHGLIFSRFLNAGRTDSMPDIDVDIEPERRHEVVEYMAQRWGDDRVVNIGTLQTFKAKSALENVGRAHDCFGRNGEIRNMSKDGKEAKGYVNSDDDLLMLMSKEEPADSEQREMWQRGAKLREFIEQNAERGELVEIAGKISGRNRGHGIHPAGVLITPGPVEDYFPIRKGKSKDDLDVCQFNCEEVDQLNGLKMDLLGLSNLTVLELASLKIERDLGKKIDLDNIPLDDEAVYEMLRRGDASGIFQIESGGMKELMKRIQPTSFADISALIALFRPGPMGMDSHNIYARRKNGHEPVEYFHDDAREILEETYGLVVYQEQVMAIAQKFAGFSEKEADDFRRAMGKKKASVMESMHADFVRRVAQQGYSENLGKLIWDTVEPFAGYAFNKAHSVSYGFITYQTAWLKANYYPQFVAAYIDVFADKSASMSADAISKGYSISAPDVNKSFVDSKSTADSIHVGFNRVASFGAGFGHAVAEEREKHGNYSSIVDFVARNPRVRKDSLESLIRVGAFESLPRHTSREDMLAAVPDIVQAGKLKAQSKKKASQFSGSFFDFDSSVLPEEDDRFDFGSSVTTSRQSRIFEREGLGFFVGAHPFSDFEPEIERLRREVPAMKHAVPTREAIHDHIIGYGQFFGVLIEYEERVSKNGREMTSFVVDCGDQSAISGMIMGHGHVAADDLLSLVLVEGKIEEDLFAKKNDSDDEEAVELRFQFGAQITVVQREAGQEINQDAMTVESRRVTGNRKNKKSIAQQRQERSTVRKSSRASTERDVARDKREKSVKSTQSAIDPTRIVQRKLMEQKKRKESVSTSDDESFVIAFTCPHLELSGHLIQHVALQLTKRSGDEGRPAVVMVNNERCDTYMRVSSANMTLLRGDMKKLSMLTGVDITISDDNTRVGAR